MRRALSIALTVSLTVIADCGLGSVANVGEQGLAEAAIREALAEYPHYDRSVRDLHRGGLAVKRAASLIASSPDALETLEALLALPGATYQVQKRPDDALRVMRAVIDKHPEQVSRAIAALLSYSYSFDGDGARDYRPTLRELLEAARSKVGSLPREDAADLAYRLIRMAAWVNRETATTTPLESFVREYAGTQAALRAELDLVSRQLGSDPRKRAEAFSAFARDHAGSCAAADALRTEAGVVGSSMGMSAGTGEQDPTERTLRVLAIASELESDAYSKCRPALGSDAGPYVFASKPVYAPGNVDRLIAAYREYLGPRLNAKADEPDNGLGYLTLRIVGDLFKAKGEGAEAHDRFLADLEAVASEPEAVRYLRALLYVPSIGQSGTDTATAPAAKTVALLTDLHRTGKGLHARKALASLAWLYRYYGDWPRAREHYRLYVTQYPGSAYAWVAALRMAECAAEAGDWQTAAAEYQAAAQTYRTQPPARVLGHASAARAHEASGDFDRATGGYREAVGGWDDDYGPRYSFDAQRRRPAVNTVPGLPRPTGEVTLPALEARLAELTRSMASPGGAVLEQGRWLVSKERWTEAAALLADFGRRFRRSPNIREAQYLAHKAVLYNALAMVDVAGKPDEASGVAALDALASEPYGFPVSAAKITKACLLWKQGSQADAEGLLHEALKERVLRQDWREPASALERDVAAIRNLLFLPTGGAVYSGGVRGWNAFSWPAAVPRFVAVPTEVRVKEAAGRTNVLSLPHRMPGLDNVLMLDADQLKFLSDLLYKVGGTERRAPRAIMETPNQPVGASLTVMALLNQFFPVRPGHWGGWEFLTYPVITEIEFMDAARTKARAKVTIGYSGCDVLLEKTGGSWRAVRLVNQWIT
jgi:tetratricopeptide (TPR) repeat protein